MKQVICRRQTHLAFTQACVGGSSKNWTWIVHVLPFFRQVFVEGSLQTRLGHHGYPSSLAHTKLPILNAETKYDHLN